MDEYKVIKGIATGGFASVFLVRRCIDMKKLAMKKLPCVSEADINMAGTEIEVLKRLQHPNIIRYYDHFYADGCVSIVMEHAAGMDLRTRIAQKRSARVRFDEAVIVEWWIQLLLALRHIHQCGLLHRDIKPGNIFLTAKATIKLGDFGLTKVLSNTATAVTQCGTPYYFSPELCRKVPYSRKSDIWSAGCVLYELLTLRHPFTGKNMRQLYRNITKLRWNPIDDYYPEPLRAVVVSIFKEDPDSRPDVDEIFASPYMAQHLERHVDKLGEAHEPGGSVVTDYVYHNVVQKKGNEVEWWRSKGSLERDAAAQRQYKKLRERLRGLQPSQPPLPGKRPQRPQAPQHSPPPATRRSKPSARAALEAYAAVHPDLHTYLAQLPTRDVKLQCKLFDNILSRLPPPDALELHEAVYQLCFDP